MLAAALTPAEIEAQFAGNIEARVEIMFDAATASLQGGVSAGSASDLAGGPQSGGGGPGARPRARARGTAWGSVWHQPAAVDREHGRSGATACCSCGEAEGEEWPDLSDAALAATVRDWLQPILLCPDKLSTRSAMMSSRAR